MVEQRTDQGVVKDNDFDKFFPTLVAELKTFIAMK